MISLLESFRHADKGFMEMKTLEQLRISDFWTNDAEFCFSELTSK
jgi:hypothetical protein